MMDLGIISSEVGSESMVEVPAFDSLRSLRICTSEHMKKKIISLDSLTETNKPSNHGTLTMNLLKIPKTSSPYNLKCAKYHQHEFTPLNSLSASSLPSTTFTITPKFSAHVTNQIRNSRSQILCLSTRLCTAQKVQYVTCNRAST